jgi:hypothetical protein
MTGARPSRFLKQNSCQYNIAYSHHVFAPAGTQRTRHGRQNIDRYRQGERIACPGPERFQDALPRLPAEEDKNIFSFTLYGLDTCGNLWDIVEKNVAQALKMGLLWNS